jgi:hypothetical protein
MAGAGSIRLQPPMNTAHLGTADPEMIPNADHASRRAVWSECRRTPVDVAPATTSVRESARLRDRERARIVDGVDAVLLIGIVDIILRIPGALVALRDLRTLKEAMKLPVEVPDELVEQIAQRREADRMGVAARQGRPRGNDGRPLLAVRDAGAARVRARVRSADPGTGSPPSRAGSRPCGSGGPPTRSGPCRSPRRADSRAVARAPGGAAARPTTPSAQSRGIASRRLIYAGVKWKVSGSPEDGFVVRVFAGKYVEEARAAAERLAEERGRCRGRVHDAVGVILDG